jgi:hypothetical protein
LNRRGVRTPRGVGEWKGRERGAVVGAAAEVAVNRKSPAVAGPSHGRSPVRDESKSIGEGARVGGAKVTRLGKPVTVKVAATPR